MGAVAAGTVLMRARYIITRKQKKQTKPVYCRAAFISLISGRCSTPWKRILTYGKVVDLFKSVNVMKELLQKIFTVL